MSFLNSFNSKRYFANPGNFESLALDLFHYQSKHNKIYANYLTALNVNTNKIKSVYSIPFLPISFFKSHEVITDSWSPTRIFESSGTSDITTSKHLIQDQYMYLTNTLTIFKSNYGEPENYHILSLLPSYLERNNSSLVMMVDSLIKSSKSEYSGFYLDEFDKLADTLKLACNSNRKVMLIGVSFGLLDFIEKYQFKMPELIVIETGGMKGRRKELIRLELHQLLKNGFGVKNIHSEYGMTELLSQAYSFKDGQFESPPWMKILIRDVNDPFTYLNTKRSGGINVIDLANTHSCAFIETQDVGFISDDNTFEVLGRFDNSDIRGCNLLIG
jgi:hypothetical protein